MENNYKKPKLIIFSLFLTIVFFAAGAITAGNAYALWYSPNWSYRQMITINSSKVPGDLTNFPVLVKTTDADLKVSPGGNVGKANGGDILFTTADGVTDIKYIDGSLDLDTETSGTVRLDSGTTIAAIGMQSETNSRYFNGIIDEVRISSTNRSPDWIETSYNNQNSPSYFLSFSSHEVFVPVPTMTEWGMIVFMILAGLGAVYYLRRCRIV